MMNPLILPVFFALIAFFVAGIRLVRPTHRGLVERLGKYSHFCPSRVQLDHPRH